MGHRTRLLVGTALVLEQHCARSKSVCAQSCPRMREALANDGRFREAGQVCRRGNARAE